ncbi:MAG: hypothetical protein ACUBOA_02730 [Candidatus Loosdrechtia sp.]|uniref:hypothetical protein n=1 Tax=Candidatus Loosdrechtia sp. TaxID=3101272 RepID=UPI003A6C8C9E|nr:MAG: hypothetical protein QY305_02115 [Candidatus Jettenia sp. AMX2]
MSKNKTRPLRLLIVDDDKDYVEELNRDAQKRRIILKHVSNLEEAKMFLESKEGRSICGIILDVICMKNKEQKVPDKSFITAALKYFGKKLPNIPIVVLTGEPDEYKNLKKLYEGTWAVYSKGQDEEAMFSFLINKARESERGKILDRYSDAFEIIEDYIGNEAEEELVNCLKNMNSTDFTIIKNNLSCLRRLQEKIYIALNKESYELVPNEYIENGIDVTKIYKHLTDKGHVKRNSIIDRFAGVIYKVTSDNGAHTPYENPDYPPTKYTVQAVTYALLDLLLWFKKTRGG